MVELRCHPQTERDSARPGSNSEFDTRGLRLVPIISIHSKNRASRRQRPLRFSRFAFNRRTGKREGKLPRRRLLSLLYTEEARDGIEGGVRNAEESHSPGGFPLNFPFPEILTYGVLPPSMTKIRRTSR